jgi:hypothetical protein
MTPGLRAVVVTDGTDGLLRVVARAGDFDRDLPTLPRDLLPVSGRTEVVQQADIAMYAAKAAGKNRVQTFSPTLLDVAAASALEAEPPRRWRRSHLGAGGGATSALEAEPLTCSRV